MVCFLIFFLPLTKYWHLFWFQKADDTKEASLESVSTSSSSSSSPSPRTDTAPAVVVVESLSASSSTRRRKNLRQLFGDATADTTDSNTAIILNEILERVHGAQVFFSFF